MRVNRIHNFACGILVIDSNGQFDPWSAGGVLHNVTDKLPAVVIPNAAHHYDLRAENEYDTPDVRHARGKEVEFISSLLWIVIAFIYCYLIQFQ